MKKIVDSLVVLFNNMNSFVLFLLIAFPVSIRFTSPNYPVANLFLSSAGGFFLLCWIYSIGARAAKSLKAQNSLWQGERLFKMLYIVILLLLVLAVIVTAKGAYPELLMVIAIVVAILFVSVVTMVANALVSAELKKKAEFKDYFTTLLLLLFPVIGVWFIQPRLKKV